MVFQCMASNMLLKISTMFLAPERNGYFSSGSWCMQVSHSSHMARRPGKRASGGAHRFSVYSLAHFAMVSKRALRSDMCVMSSSLRKPWMTHQSI